MMAHICLSIYHWTSLPKIYKGVHPLILKKRTRKTAKLSLLVFDTKAYYAVSLNILFFVRLQSLWKTKNFGGLIKMIDKINITGFPKNVFIELPNNYRNILFQLVFLESKNARNVIKSLKEKGLKENIFRWRRGHDKGLPQFINLESLLFLLYKAQISRINIQKKVHVIKLRIRGYNERVEKSEELISLIRSIRYILNGSGKMAQAFKMNPRTLNKYISNKKIKKLPIDFVIRLVKFAESNVLCFNLTINELQDKIISYQAYHGKYIKPEFQGARKLPIQVTPEFESIVYHLMGDGHVKAIGSGECTQLSDEGRKNFLNKLYNVFGYFEITEKSFSDGRVIIPRVIIDIICRYYNLNYDSFNWNTSKLPLNISSNADFKIAGLSAFIVDEGHINNRGIEIYSGNRQLLSEIRTLAVDLGLDCSDLKAKKPNGNSKESYRFRIRKESSKEFLKMVANLKKNYQYCGLAQKENLML